jgi:D-serine dehydratase
LRVLVEIGYAGGRTGCRTVQAGLALAREVRAQADVLALSGVEGFEGIIREKTEADTVAKVEAFVDQIVDLGQACADEDLFAEGLVLFSAGGSAFYDIVSAKLARIQLRQERLVLLRAGCYLTHDSLMYTYLFAQLRARAPQVDQLGAGLTPALEIWAYVQSLPEPGKAIVAMGKRDVSYDHMPVPLVWFRPGGDMGAPEPVPTGHKVTELNDQHAFVAVPDTSPWRVGDLVGFGISHPCLTFDKWRVLHLVDDAYTVTGSLRTYF